MFPNLLKIEQARSVVGVPKHIRRRLVDGYLPGSCGSIRSSACMDTKRVEVALWL